jgi:hypothetical protein
MGLKIMKAKSMTAMLLFLALLPGLSSIVSAQITQITENTYADIFPQTAGGYVVWQARIDGDWEIFLYNANDNTGPFQITDNAYDDIKPNTDGKYVTWAAGSARYGEIFIYDIDTSITTQLTSNIAYDANPEVFNGLVVWVSTPVGDNGLGMADIFLYDDITDNNTIYNVSAVVDPDNIYNDYAFRFDGRQIFWSQENVQQGSNTNYLYDLATGSTYLYNSPDDDDEISVPYLYDLATGATYQKPGGLILQDNPQEDGDFLVFESLIDGIDGDREIVLRDKKNIRGGPITANDIEDSQPSIGGNIVAWKGDKGDDAEIYIYEIPPFYADAGHDLYLASEHVSQTIIQGLVGGETDGLQYRWFDWNGYRLSDWQPIIDRRAPLSLGFFSGLVVGTYPFSLEVTNGNITMNDQMVLSVENWHLTLVSPDDGIEFQKKEFPVFVWDSRGYLQFKIQFSTVASFERKTPSFPKTDDAWLNEPSITLDKTQAAELKELIQDKDEGIKLLYWRVLAQDRYGNEEISQARSIVVSNGLL